MRCEHRVSANPRQQGVCLKCGRLLDAPAPRPAPKCPETTATLRPMGGGWFHVDMTHDARRLVGLVRDPTADTARPEK